MLNHAQRLTWLPGWMLEEEEEEGGGVEEEGEEKGGVGEGGRRRWGCRCWKRRRRGTRKDDDVGSREREGERMIEEEEGRSGNGGRRELNRLFLDIIILIMINKYGNDDHTNDYYYKMITALM